MDTNDIIIVTGMPRSGTSLMMQILQSMGIELFTDNQRSADESNPKGYYENELVKTIQIDNSWLKDAKGKAIKIVSPLIKWLPIDLKYKIILMDRNLDEIVQSQERMLSQNDIKENLIKPEDLKLIFLKDLKLSKDWINKQLNCDYLEILHSKILNFPESEIERLKSFLNSNANISSVFKVIDKKLYRSKVE